MTRLGAADAREPRWPSFPPPWADVFGEDRYGVYAAFDLNDVSFLWRWIPPGRFLMGSPPDEVGRYDREGPQHKVVITAGFWLAETPVTQAQWSALMPSNPSRFQGRDHPVERVAVADCDRLVTALNERVVGLEAGLPSEAQWEYACRSGTQGAFGDGSDCSEPDGKDPALERLGWYDENSEKQTHPVKLRSPNRWGLYDMHGNVLEWCRDGMRDYRAVAEVDPEGAVTARGERVVRGGSWINRARYCRAAFRGAYGPEGRGGDLGFRLAAGLEPGGAERPSSDGRRSEG